MSHIGIFHDGSRLFPAVKKSKNLAYFSLVLIVQFCLLHVVLIEAQSLCAGQMVLGHFIQTRQILDDAILQEGGDPEQTVWAVNEKNFPVIVYQDVTPFQVIMRKGILVQASGDVGQLAAGIADPFAVFQ